MRNVRQLLLVIACLCVRPMMAAAAQPVADSISIDLLGTLPALFSDRYITQIASHDPGNPVHAGGMFMSDDGLHMAFMKDVGSSRSMVVDGVEGNTYGWVSRGVYSLEGAHFAYLAGPSDKGGPTLVVDGREIALGTSARGPVQLSPDGRRWALVSRARRDRTERPYVITDRNAGSPQDSIGAVVFSWDGTRLAYVAKKWTRYVVVIDGTESPEYDEVAPPMFDLSGEHVVYACRSGSTWRVVRDGQQSEGYNWLDLGSIRFDPTGMHLCYVAGMLSRSAMLFVDGEPGPLYQSVVTDSCVFTPDGKHTVYWAGQDTYVPMLDDQALGADTPSPGAIVASANGGHIAYSECTSDRRHWHVVLDNVAGRSYDAVDVPTFSIDGTRIAYRVRRGDYQAVVVDGDVGPDCQVVGAPVFSHDSRHVAYLAWLASGRCIAIVDGRRGPEFDWLASTGPTFLADSRLAYLAVRKSQLLRITHVLREGNDAAH